MMETKLRKVYKTIVSNGEEKLRLRRSINRRGVKIPNKQNVVFLTVGNKETQAYVTKGTGRNLRRAINEAVENYLKYKPKKHQPKQLQVDILHNYTPINNDDTKYHIRNDKIRYDRGGEGLAFGDDFHTVFLPSEVAGYGIIRRQKLNIRNSFRALHKHLPTSFSKFTKPYDERTKTTAYRIRTKSYYIDDENYYELYRNHRIFTELNDADLLEAIQLTKDNYF